MHGGARCRTVAERKWTDRLKKLLLLTALCIPSLHARLEEKPWFGNCFEFLFSPSYEYNFFDRVNNAVPQLRNTYNTQVVDVNFNVTAPEIWNWEADFEFACPTGQSYGYRSSAYQIRRLWMDDVCGDPVSFTTGFVYRNNFRQKLKALSTPYHSPNNFELNAAVGKEWSHGCFWYFRTFGKFGIGQGTTGSPWITLNYYLWGNICNRHQMRLYLLSYFGLGQQHIVHTKHFRGWSKIQHQSLDIGFSYCYDFDYWGSLRFDYARRVYAKSYPEMVNTFLFTFEIPFCPF